MNLSVTDLLTCLLVPFECVVIFSESDSLPVSRRACGLLGIAVYVLIGTSLYTLASIGLYRLIFLKDIANRYVYKLHSWYVATLWISATWTFSILVNLVPHAIGAGRFGYNEKYHACGAKSSHPRNRELEIAQAFGLFAVPFTVIVVSYSLIFIHIRQHDLNILRSVKTKNLDVNTGETTSTSVAKSIRRRQISITKNMFYVVISFTVCLTPYTICLLFPQLNGLLYSAVLVTANAGINPILYGYKHPTFREIFRVLLKRQWNAVPEQSSGFKKLLHITGMGPDSNSV